MYQFLEFVLAIKFYQNLNGGSVKQSKHREFGLANIYKKNNSLLTKIFLEIKNPNKFG